jgi:hypothetical protein
MDPGGSGWCLVAGFCDYGNELLGSLNVEGSFNYLSGYLTNGIIFLGVCYKILSSVL